MSHYEPPASRAEWVQSVADGRHATLDAGPGHHISVAEPGRIQARCTCGWEGPDRTGDEHATGLVVDDAEWHEDQVALDDLNWRLKVNADAWWQQAHRNRGAR